MNGFKALSRSKALKGDIATEFNPLSAGRVVVGVGRTQNAIDGALKKFSLLTTDILETFEEAKVSDVASQRVLERLAEGFKAMVDGRGAFVDAHLELIALKMVSNLRDVPIGCVPGPVCARLEHTALETNLA